MLKQKKPVNNTSFSDFTKEYYIHILLFLSFLVLVFLISIDPAMSFYSYMFLAKKDAMVLQSVNFASQESFDAALQVFWTFAALYVIKTDGRFVDKFINVLTLFKNRYKK